MKINLLGIVMMGIGCLMSDVALSDEEHASLDLSSLLWAVSIEGREGIIAEAPFEEALSALVEEFDYAEVAVFEVAVPVSAEHLATPHAFVLGPIHTASEVYFDGQMIGKSGNITDRSREYLDLAPGRQTQVMLLPEHIWAPGTYVLRIRAQAKVFTPGPVRGPRVLLPVQEAISLAQRNNRILYIGETMWITITLLVMLIVFLRVGFRLDADNRDRWLPLLLLAGLGGLGVQSFIFNELGLLSPLTLRLGYTLPVHLLILLHVYAALGLKRPVWQTLVILGLSLSQVVAVWWDSSTSLYPVKDLTVTITAVVLTAFLGFAALKAHRMGHRVSFWTYFYIVYLVVFILVFAFMTPVMDLLIGPGWIMALLGICIFALGAIDHARWDREAVTALSQDLLHSGEQERGRLARELHDGLSHRLALIRMRLESIGRASGETPDAMVETVDELRASSDELTAIVEGLRPLSLTGGNLQVALEAFADRWRRMSDIIVDTQIDADTFPDEETQLHLLRIAQEAVQNAVRHGKAIHVSIDLTVKNGQLVLCVEDNGKGFEIQTITVDKGMGLTTMRQRVELLKGILDIDGGPGRGTKIRVEISVP